MPTLRANTREAHRALYESIHRDFEVSFDDSRLVRKRCTQGAKRGRVATAAATNYVMFAGVRFRAHEAAHVLRVGPEGPLWPNDRAAPADGDWTNVHPRNWPPRSAPLGAAGRAAAARAREAAIEAGLMRAGVRPGEPWFSQPRGRGARSVLTDARYWWAKQAAAAGETDRTLSVPWESARQRSPRHWAVCHHLAHRASELLGAGPTSAARIASVQAELLQERAAIYADPQRLAVAAAWASRASAAGEIHDTPEQAARNHHASADAAATPLDDLY